jgi:RNA methyltransferase, TrmH family
MISKSKIQYIQALKTKKYRLTYGSFLVEGEKMAKEVLESDHLEVEALYATSTWIFENKHLSARYFNQTLTITEQELKSISSLNTPNQILLVVKIRDFSWNETKIRQDFSFYLDGIQDPGNMGTILRIADWFGMPTVFCSPTCVDVYNPKVVQATMGALCRIQTTEINYTDLMARLPNFPTYATSMQGENIFKIPSFPKGIIAIGNEGNGLSPEILANADQLIAIPKHGHAESLNAGVAAGIIAAIMTNCS